MPPQLPSRARAPFPPLRVTLIVTLRMPRSPNSGQLDLSEVFRRVQRQMLAQLAVGRLFEHASSAWSATEQHWLELFHRYLPRRYRATPARPYSIKSAAGAGPMARRRSIRRRTKQIRDSSALLTRTVRVSPKDPCSSEQPMSRGQAISARRRLASKVEGFQTELVARSPAKMRLGRKGEQERGLWSFRKKILGANGRKYPQIRRELQFALGACGSATLRAVRRAINWVST